MNLSTSRYGHQKYTVVLADIVGLGAALTGDITLDTLPPGTVIKGYTVKASTAIAGGTIATATAQPKLNSALLGPGTTNVFAVAAEPTNALVTNPANGVGNLSSTNTLKLTLTTTTGNLNAATQGQIDVIVDYGTLAL